MSSGLIFLRLISANLMGSAHFNLEGFAIKLGRATLHFTNQDRNAKGYRHNEEVKKFAVSLHYFSPAAYEYVKSVFALPSPRSISNWTSSIACEPGLFIDVLDQIEIRKETQSEYQDCWLLCYGN